MDKNLIAKASISIKASNHNVWNALVDPHVIKQYMFGTNVVSDWREGRPIIWKGEWQGKSYEDKGVIVISARFPVSPTSRKAITPLPSI